jgi:hypothetical protein
MLAQANVLIDIGRRACITDFGLASVRGPIQGSAFLRTSSDAPAAVRWTAIEVITMKVERPTVHSDVYSFGCVALQVSYLCDVDSFGGSLVQIATGKVPWSELEDANDVARKSRQGLVPSKPEGCQIEDGLWKFIERCWESVPKHRPTSFDALDFAEIEFRAMLSMYSNKDQIDEADSVVAYREGHLAAQPSQGALSRAPISGRFTPSENHTGLEPRSLPVSSPLPASPSATFSAPCLNTDPSAFVPGGSSPTNVTILTSTIRKAQPDVDTPEVVDRKVKALLNKLTEERFDSISDQIIQLANKSVNEKDGRTLVQVIRLVFDKATDEVNCSEMCARLCRKMMEQVSPDVQDDGIKNQKGKPMAGGQLFRKHLIHRCQEDFERGSKAKRQGLGLMKFIGELFKLQMLTERVMHECVKKLLGNVEYPEEEEIESLCQLLETIGQLLDTPKTRAHMDVYFTHMKELSKNINVSYRMQIMLQVCDEYWLLSHCTHSPS